MPWTLNDSSNAADGFTASEHISNLRNHRIHLVVVLIYGYLRLLSVIGKCIYSIVQLLQYWSLRSYFSLVI